MKRVLGCMLLALTVTATAEEESYSPTVEDNFPREVFWGDLHVHSNLSPDSFSFGNPNLGPDAAYRFAKGEAVTASTGRLAQLRRPLDFLMVADHAEFLGVFPRLISQDEALLATSLGERWGGYLAGGDMSRVMTEFVDAIQGGDYEQELSAAFRRDIWRDAASIADDHNQPGIFTAFVGYEWTSMVNGNNLHRVVVFKDGAEVAASRPPFSSLDSQDPEDLWAALADYEEATGGKVMAIPHNGNLSNGLMFADTTLGGEMLDADYARRRARWEPLYEVTQVKGDAEAHPLLSPDDEFAAYENWDADNIGRVQEKETWMLNHEYARPALKLGLKWEAALGVNPFDFGMIGSTDSHTTLATADDDNFWGKFNDSEPKPDRTANTMGGRLWYNWKLAASGYAAVWARENTREALFEAMARKEVYTTTGPRIALRFFGGWDYPAGAEDTPDLARLGYAAGVPMGGRLGNARAEAPVFLIQALRDPDGANLDRVQIVKGWLDASGKVQERVYNVAMSDGRKTNRRGQVQAVGSTVDVANASYDNSIGAAELTTRWVDPDFDQNELAFYYVRVLEIPTPRWTAYDAKAFGLELDPQIPMINQERVYSSPIWYSP